MIVEAFRNVAAVGTPKIIGRIASWAHQPSSVRDSSFQLNVIDCQGPVGEERAHGFNTKQVESSPGKTVKHNNACSVYKWLYGSWILDILPHSS